jgi:hypothetical protein
MKEELDVPCESYFYTDSKIVLGYLSNTSKRFYIYVTNRISQIRELTDASQWHHVISKDNPADYASRGLSPDQLKTSSWLTGPQFLWQYDFTHVKSFFPVPDDDPEVRPESANVLLASENSPGSLLLQHIDRYSKWSMALTFTTLVHAVSDIVLLKDGMVRTDWRLGRVTSVFPSEDGLVRRVKLRVGARRDSSATTLERPVSQLVVLIESGTPSVVS